MKQENKVEVELEMKKALCAEETIDNRRFKCSVLKYDAEKEHVYLLLEEGNLSDISLDALYECRIDAGEENVMCDGVVKERYRNEEGKILEFRIKNGFYKINIKSVDK